MNSQWRVLLLHSEGQALHEVQLSLAQVGCSVFFAADATNMMRHVYQVQPHLIILESPGTKVAAWDTLKKVRSLSGRPMLVLSDHGDEVDRAMCDAVGVDDYLGTPFGVAQLVVQAKALLSKVQPPQDSDLFSPSLGDNMVYLVQPLKCLTPTQLMQIDELLLMVRSSGRIRLLKTGNRVTQVSLIQKPSEGNQ